MSERKVIIADRIFGSDGPEGRHLGRVRWWLVVGVPIEPGPVVAPG